MFSASGEETKSKRIGRYNYLLIKTYLPTGDFILNRKTEYSKLPEHGCFWRISSCEHFRVLSDLPAQGSLESHDKASTLAVKKVADINIRYEVTS